MLPARHLALIVLIDLIWSFNVVAIKSAFAHVAPLTAVLLRYAIVLLVCLPWLRWIPGRMPLVLLTGVIGGAAFFGLGALSFAVADNVSALAIAGQLGVPFSLILAVLFLRERIRWPRIVGVTLAFVGVVVLGFDPAIAHERLGLGLTVAAAFLYAVSSLFMRRLKGVHPLTIHAWLAAISIPLLAVASLIFEPGALVRADDLPWSTFGWLAYSAIGASVVGHAGMSWLFQRHEVSVIAPLTLPTPLLSVAWGVMLLGTPLTGQMIAGGTVAVIGVAIITIRTARVRTRGEGR